MDKVLKKNITQDFYLNYYYLILKISYAFEINTAILVQNNYTKLNAKK